MDKILVSYNLPCAADGKIFNWFGLYFMSDFFFEELNALLQEKPYCRRSIKRFFRMKRYLIMIEWVIICASLSPWAIGKSWFLISSLEAGPCSQSFFFLSFGQSCHVSSPHSSRPCKFFHGIYFAAWLSRSSANWLLLLLILNKSAMLLQSKIFPSSIPEASAIDFLPPVGSFSCLSKAVLDSLIIACLWQDFTLETSQFLRSICNLLRHCFFFCFGFLIVFKNILIQLQNEIESSYLRWSMKHEIILFIKRHFV